jgi:hypothetical protein
VARQVREAGKAPVGNEIAQIIALVAFTMSLVLLGCAAP